MDRVFISSVITGYGEERAAAKGAIESLDLRVVMAENAASSPDPSKVALLGQIDRCDAVVLLLAGWYGHIGENGLSPTEDEYNHAVARGKPVLAFVHDGVEREDSQQAFIGRVRGTWDRDGVYTSSFRTPAELALLVVRALNEQRSRDQGGSAMPAAQERTRTLAARNDRRGQFSARRARVVYVPVGIPGLVDAFVLDDAKLADRVIESARRRSVMSQSSGADSGVDSSGVTVVSRDQRHDEGVSITLADDGAVIVELAVGAGGGLGGMAISQPRVVAGITAAGLLAQDLWGLLPDGDRVGQVCAAIGIPDASHAAYSISGQVGNSMSMGSAPSPLIAPDPPVVLRRGDVGAGKTSDKLAVPLKRLFADHRSVID